MLVFLFIVLAWTIDSVTAHGPWNYNDSSTWGGICATGNLQSPINIDLGDTEDEHLPAVEFHHYDAKGTVVAMNNGHTELVQGFNSWTTQPSITGGGLGARYVLQQFHFHWSDEFHYGSEHSVNEARYPLELHFVHIREGLNEKTAAHAPAGIAVIAVFFQESEDGHALFELDRALQGTRAVNQSTDVNWYSPATLLPSDTLTFFRYNGSLTTPPCYENVIWTVLTKPNHVTRKQLETLREHLEDNQHLLINNWRPTQPLNGRKIQLTKAKHNTWKYF